MKKTFFICFIVAQLSSVAQVYDYPVKPGSAEWNSLDNTIDRIKVCEVPGNILSAMSTDDLVQTVLNHPLMGDVLASNNFDIGFGTMINNINCFKELSNRVDAGESLIAAYSQMDVDKYYKTDTTCINYGSYRFNFLELFLAQSNIVNTLDADTQKKALKKLLLKLNEKCKTEELDQMQLMLSGWVVFKLLMQVNDKCFDFDAKENKALLDYYTIGSCYDPYIIDTVLDIALDNAEVSTFIEYPIGPGPAPTYTTVYTPHGTPVTAKNIHEECSNIEEMNHYFDEDIPEAVVVGDFSLKYNCHSYALHRTEGNWYNVVWIDKAKAYYTDGSFVRTASPDDAEYCKVGYRVRESYQGKFEPKVYAHSAIKSNTPGKFISKWGFYALYEHSLEDVPTPYLDKVLLPNERVYYFVSSKINGPASVSRGEIYTYWAEDVEGCSYNWETSSNIQIINDFGQGITVKAASSSIPSWVKVNMTTNIGKEAITTLNLDVGIDSNYDFKSYNVNIYPNPTSDLINVTFEPKADKEEIEELNYSVAVFNSQGSPVLNTKSGNNLFQIDLSNSEKGNYYLQIIQDGETYTEQIILN